MSLYTLNWQIFVTSTVVNYPVKFCLLIINDPVASTLALYVFY